MLPKRPPISDPIPNANIANVPEQYTVKAPYWDAPIADGLIVSSEGALELEGGEGGGDPNVTVKGAWWNMPIGQGLQVVDDKLTTYP